MKTLLLLVGVMMGFGAVAQEAFSINTSVSGLRNFTPQEKFWALGQNVQVNLHFYQRETAYASLEYYTEEKFRDRLTSTAKSVFTSPQAIDFTATGKLRFRQISLGWKHYFTGGYSQDKGVSLFGLAGFGYLFAKITNNADPSIDTLNYTSPIAFGESKVKRLTFDLGLGAETHIRGPVYTFATVRAWLPASYHPSRYLPNSDRMPLALMAGAGVRILFGTTY